MTQHGPNRATPAVLVLESRDVPALFYVDPLFDGIADGTTVKFNDFGPGTVAGRVVGTDAFATLTEALTVAAANAEADTIFLARSRFDTDLGAITGDDLAPNRTPVDNTAGPILINDNITLIGSGAGATTLAPTKNTVDEATGVFEVAAGKSFTVRDLSLDGSGFEVGVGFRFGGAGVVGSVSGVEVTNVAFAPINGIGIGAFDGAVLTVADSKVSGYGRVGVGFYDASGSVTGSVLTGKGAGTTFVNYGLQLAGDATVTATGNTITGNTATAPAGGGFVSISAGVNLFEFGGAAPTATLTQNTITGNTLGVQVGGEFGVDASTASIHDNNLQGNFLAIQADNKTVVDATNNWYGDASGPYQITDNTAGKGSEVTDQVAFAPWRTTPFVPTTVVTKTVTVTETKTVTVIETVTVFQPVPPAQPQPANPAPVLAVAVGGSGAVTALTGGAVSVLGARPFGGFAGEVRVARADVTGDGVPDVIAAVGPGGGPQVVVLDGATGALVRSFYAYSAAFTGGVFVAAGDLNGDGRADIVTGAGAGAGPHVKAFDGATGAEIRSFFAYAAGFGGGVTVAAGDVTGDGIADIVTGAGAGGGSNVRVFDGTNGVLVRSFYAYPPQFTGGIYVAVGDVDGDGFGDLVTGAGQGGGSNVRVFDGETNALLASFFADAGVDRGVRVAAQDLDGDGKDDLAFGPGPGGDNRLRVTFASALLASNATPNPLGQPLFGTADGLNVG